MDRIKNLEAETASLAENVQEFTENPSKAKSKRLRLELGELKKKVTGYRSTLLELDSKGY